MINHAKRDRARELRGNATPFEQIFWQTVRGHRFAGFKFRRQQVIGPFIVDFACLSAKLVVELDGSQHAEAVAYDTQRDAWLNSEGYRVFRVWNNEWTQQQEAVLERLWEMLNGTAPSPQPLPLSINLTLNPSPAERDFKNICLTKRHRLLNQVFTQATRFCDTHKKKGLHQKSI